MNLDHLTDFAHLAEPHIYERGKMYFYNNMISYAEIELHEKTAYIEVKGSDIKPYIVEIKELTNPSLSITCTCPYDKGLCKHQVAALLYIKKNFKQLEKEYKQRYYPHLPMNENNKFIDSYLEKFKPFYPKNYEKADELLYENSVKYTWINPLIQKIKFNIKEHKVEIKNYLTPKIDITCTCMKDFCEHKIAALERLKKLFNENNYQKIKAHYLREKNKFIMLGLIDEIQLMRFHKFIPKYLPKYFDLITINQKYIKLRVNVRYKSQIVEFRIKGDYVVSTCSCNDDVSSLCKHQIATINLLNNLQPSFFQELISNNIQKLKQLFI